jgi:antitoxin component YwqK of YwqJK toxin-antitoxin module
VKIFIIIVIVISPFVVVAQDCKFSYYNKKGGHYLFSTFYLDDMQTKRDGVCETKVNDKIYEKRILKNGLLVEEELNFFSQNQTIQKRIRTKMNHYPVLSKELGTMEEFNEKGILVTYWRFYLDKENRRRSQITEYHHFNGKLRFKQEYAFIRLSEIDSYHIKDHPPHTVDEFGYTYLTVPYGIHQEFDDQGNLIREQHYNTLTFYDQDSQHILDGPYKEFYANGKPKVVATYKEGNLDSSWISYHYNGKLMETGVYRNNIKAGIWEGFNDIGKLIKRGVYDEKATNPFAPTQETTWNDAGLKIEEKYIDEKEIAQLNKWNNQGLLVQHTEFMKSTQMNWSNQSLILLDKIWYEDGKIKQIINNYPKSDTNFISYYPSGQLKDLRIGNWKNNIRLDQQSSWNERGILTMKSSREYNQDGSKTRQTIETFYSNGNKKTKNEFINKELYEESYSMSGILYKYRETISAKIDGIYREIDTLTGLKTEINYSNGIRNGACQLYNSKDKIPMIKSYNLGCSSKQKLEDYWIGKSIAEKSKLKNEANFTLLYAKTPTFQTWNALLNRRDSIAIWTGKIHDQLNERGCDVVIQELELKALTFNLPHVYYIGLDKKDTSNQRVKSLLHILDSMNWSLKNLKLENGSFVGKINLDDFISYPLFQKILKEHNSFFYPELDHKQNPRIDYGFRESPTSSLTMIESNSCYAKFLISDQGHHAQLIVYEDGEVEFENQIITWEKWKEQISNPIRNYMFKD